MTFPIELAGQIAKLAGLMLIGEEIFAAPLTRKAGLFGSGTAIPTAKSLARTSLGELRATIFTPDHAWYFQRLAHLHCEDAIAFDAENLNDLFKGMNQSAASKLFGSVFR
jgi:hypothetical protein